TGKVVEPGLRAGVVHLQHAAPLPADRRDVDDTPPLLLQHVGQRLLRARERAAEVDREHAVPVGVADLRKRLLLRDRRVVDEDANRTERAANLADRGANAGAIFGNETDGDRLAAGRPNGVDRRTSVLLARRVGQRDGMSAGGKCRGNRAADAAAAAGDQRGPAHYRISFRTIARRAASAIDWPVRP